MPWPDHIARWQQFADWEARDVPAGIVLSIIEAESNGRPGAKGYKPLKGALLPHDDGSKEEVFTPLGLMQPAPRVIASYNDSHTPPATIEDMTGTDERGARQQIRVGSWAYAREVNRLHKWDKETFPAPSPQTATADQLRIALASYATGPAPILETLDAARAKRRPITFDAISRAPSSPTAAAGFAYARKRWDVFKTREADAVAQIERKDKAEKKDGAFGVFGILAAFLIWKFLKRKTQSAAQDAPLLTA